MSDENLEHEPTKEKGSRKKGDKQEPATNDAAKNPLESNEQEKAVEQAPPTRLVVKCLKDFPAWINGSSVPFRKGQTVGDYQRAKFLLDKKFPVVEVSQDEYHLCDNCGHIQKRG